MAVKLKPKGKSAAKSTKARAKPTQLLLIAGEGGGKKSTGSAAAKRPRPASLTAETSFASCSALRNAVTGTASLVSLSIMIAMPTPQLG